MTEELLEQFGARLARKLGIDETDQDEYLLMQDALKEAESELLLYLNMEELPEKLHPYVVKLAALFYQRDIQALDGGGEKSWSYSEVEQTQSVTLMTVSDYQEGVDDLLSSLARYRLVSVRGGGDETA